MYRPIKQSSLNTIVLRRKTNTLKVSQPEKISKLAFSNANHEMEYTNTEKYPSDIQFPKLSQIVLSLVHGVAIWPVRAREVVAITWSGASNIEVIVTVNFVKK